MITEPGQHSTRALDRFPLRAALGSLLIITAYFLAGALSAGDEIWGAAGLIALVFFSLFVYRWVYAACTPSTTAPFGQLGPFWPAAFGAGFAMTLAGGSLVALVSLGYYHIEWSFGNYASLGALFFSSAAAAVAEECIFRGFVLTGLSRLFRKMRVGALVAVFVSAVLFGAVHSLNPAASVWGVIAIICEAGIPLGLMMLLTRRISSAIALHLTFNFIESALGVPVSGSSSIGVATITVNGPTLITGGQFGLEASVFTVAWSLALSIPLAVAVFRRNSLSDVGK